MQNTDSETRAQFLRERAEALRQEIETFDQAKKQADRIGWLRVGVGWAAVVIGLVAAAVSARVILRPDLYPDAAVVGVSVALATDVIAAAMGVWQVVLSPGFTTRLAPVTEKPQIAVASLDEKPRTAPASLDEKPAQAVETIEGTLTILSAKWGYEDASVDVTDILQSHIVNDKLVIHATVYALESDPARGEVKSLQVIYSYAGARFTKTVRETHILSLP